MKTFIVCCNRPFYNPYKHYFRNQNRYAHDEAADTMEAAQAIAANFVSLGYTDVKIRYNPTGKIVYRA